MSGRHAAAGEPYLGPATGNFDAALVILGRVEDRRRATDVTQSFPVYTGPRTGEMAKLEDFSAAREYL